MPHRPLSETLPPATDDDGLEDAIAERRISESGLAAAIQAAADQIDVPDPTTKRELIFATLSEALGTYAAGISGNPALQSDARERLDRRDAQRQETLGRRSDILGRGGIAQAEGELRRTESIEGFEREQEAGRESETRAEEAEGRRFTRDQQEAIVREQEAHSNRLRELFVDSGALGDISKMTDGEMLNAIRDRSREDGTDVLGARYLRFPDAGHVKFGATLLQELRLQDLSGAIHQL